MADRGPDTPESWSAASAGYAERVAPVMMQTFADELVDRLAVDADTDALEVGAGSGALTTTLGRRVRSLLATDFAPGMVDILRARTSDMVNVRCAVMDGQALELDDDSFDRAASSFALMLFPDRARGFAELRRVVRPGGRVAISGWAGPDRFEAFALFTESMQAAFPDLPPPAEPPPVFSLADPGRFASEMQAAGFEEVEVGFVSRPLRFAGADEVWSMLTTGAPPVKMLFDRVGEDGKARVREALDAIIEERFGHGPVEVTNVATFGTGSVGG